MGFAYVVHEGLYGFPGQIASHSEQGIFVPSGLRLVSAYAPVFLLSSDPRALHLPTCACHFALSHNEHAYLGLQVL